MESSKEKSEELTTHKQGVNIDLVVLSSHNFLLSFSIGNGKILQMTSVLPERSGMVRGLDPVLAPLSLSTG